MKLFNTIKNTIYWLVISLLIILALTTTFSLVKGPGGWRAFVVLSGSMEPKIRTGSVVLVIPQKEYKKDEIITFFANPKANLKDPGSTVTHRIVEVKDDEGRPTFTTKGDANNGPDRESVTQASVLGKVRLSIPYLGYAVAFAKTQTGLIVLIIVPATLIIYGELINIKNELRKMIGELKEKRAQRNKVIENPEIKIIEDGKESNAEKLNKQRTLKRRKKK